MFDGVVVGVDVGIILATSGDEAALELHALTQLRARTVMMTASRSYLADIVCAPLL